MSYHQRLIHRPQLVSVSPYFRVLNGAVSFLILLISATPLVRADDSRPAKISRALMQMYNGFIARGDIPGDRIGGDTFRWDRATVTNLREALTHFGAQGGGYITEMGVYSSRANLSIAPTQLSKFGLAISEPGMPTATSEVVSSYIPYDCTVEDFQRADALSLVRLSQSVRCLFAREVRRVYFEAAIGEREMSFDNLANESVSNALRRYLESIVTTGALDSFEIRFDRADILVALSDGYHGPITLALDYVSPYLDAAEEAGALINSFEAAAKREIIFFTDGASELLSAGELLSALARAESPDLSSGDTRREEFMLALGINLAQALPPIIPGIVFRPCRYSTGIVTPCNRQVADLYGIDHNGAIGPRLIFPRTKSALSSFGYDFKTIDLSSSVFSSRFNESTEFQKLRAAQTVIINAHGDSAGRFGLQCYWDIPLLDGSGRRIGRACCERMKSTARALGLPGADSINCDQNDRPFQDPSGAIMIESVSTCSGPNGGHDRCQIVATPAFYNSIGTKAAVLTGQCSGGRCGPLAGGTAAMDFFSESILLNFSGRDTPHGFDDALLADDLLGETNYCLTNLHPNTPPDRLFHEPFGGHKFDDHCQGRFARLYPGSPSPLRTIQWSRETRGASGQFGSPTLDCSGNYGDAGFTEYCVAAPVAGAPATLVEFAPTVDHVDYHEPSLTLTIIPTSILANDCDIEVSVVGDAPPTISTALPYVRKQCGATGATIQFSGDPGLLHEFEWGGSPTVLREFYGHDQSDWPWYLKVVMRAKAPNGVNMIGNQGAAQKWLWSRPQIPPDAEVAPYLASLGMQSSGGTSFELWLPVAPPSQCCMPNIEFRGLPPAPHQNGCTCGQSVGMNRCFMGTCVLGNDSDGYQGFAVAGMRPEECNGRYQRFEGSWRLNHDCCPVSVNGVEMCPARRVQNFPEPDHCIPGDEYLSAIIEYNYIARPWDAGGIRQCPAIVYHGVCDKR